MLMGRSTDDPIKWIAVFPVENAGRQTDLGSDIKYLDAVSVSHVGQCCNAGLHFGPLPETNFLSNLVEAYSADRHGRCCREYRSGFWREPLLGIEGPDPNMRIK